MNCEAVQERMVEWMDGRIAPDLANELKAHLDACPGCQAELAATRRFASLLDRPPMAAPSPALRQRVFAAIAEEMAGAPAPAAPAIMPARPLVRRNARWRAWLPRPLLQGLLAVALLGAGYWAGVRRPAPAMVATTAPSLSAPATQRDVAEIRQQLGQLVGYTLEQQQHSSTDQRLQAVLQSAAQPNSDPNAVDRLITAVAMDPCVNVRLSAVQALYSHSDRDVVRTAIAVTLPREPSPLVQLAMIDFLTACRDRAAAPVLAKLSSSADDPSVKDAAGRALAQLEPDHF